MKVNPKESLDVQNLMQILEKDMKLMLEGNADEDEADVELVNIETARTVKSST